MCVVLALQALMCWFLAEAELFVRIYVCMYGLLCILSDPGNSVLLKISCESCCGALAH